MMIQRRNALMLGATGLAAPMKLFARTAQVKLIVGYAAGGAADLVARALAEGLRGVGYTGIVENKGGAAGRLAVESIISGPANADAMLLAPLGSLTLHPHIFRAGRYNPKDELVPVAGVASMSFAFAVSATSPVRTLKDYLAAAAGDPNLAAFATPGAGSNMHFIGTLLSKESKILLTHVGYKGGAAALNDLVGGTVPAIVATTPALLPLHRVGKIRILATTDEQAHPALQGIPTFKSLGYGSLDQQEIFGIFLKRGTPAQSVAALEDACLRAARSPQVIEILKKNEYAPVGLDSSALSRQVSAQYAAWGRIVRESGYTPES